MCPPLQEIYVSAQHVEKSTDIVNDQHEQAGTTLES